MIKVTQTGLDSLLPALDNTSIVDPVFDANKLEASSSIPGTSVAVRTVIFHYLWFIIFHVGPHNIYALSLHLKSFFL